MEKWQTFLSFCFCSLIYYDWLASKRCGSGPRHSRHFSPFVRDLINFCWPWAWVWTLVYLVALFVDFHTWTNHEPSLKQELAERNGTSRAERSKIGLTTSNWFNKERSPEIGTFISTFYMINVIESCPN